MTIHELDIASARTAPEETLAVLFDGSRDEFAAWSDALISATYRLEGDTK